MRGIFYFKFCLLLVLNLNGTAALGSSLFTIDSLEQLLKSNTSHVVGYQETRESPWLQEPIISEGTMESRPPMIEKIAILPRPQTWRLYPDYMEMSNPDGSKRVYYSQSPQVGVLANAIRGLVTGEIVTLRHEFYVEIKGSENSWSVQLKPRTEDASKYLRLIEFDGTNSSVKRIVVIEAQGEKTTTLLIRQPTP